MTRNRSLLLLALVPWLCAATCGAPYRVPPRVCRTVSHELQLPAKLDRIEVQFHDGLLTLEAGAEAGCALTIDLCADDDAALGRLVMRVAPQIEVDGTTAKLQVALPAGSAMDAVRTTWRLRAPPRVAIAVHTRLGAVVAREAAGDLEVSAGSGVVDVQMAGGTANLATTSGSLMLRGEYHFAELRSDLGRIDLQLPGGNARTDVDLRCGRGDVYVDLHREQKFRLEYTGDEKLVYCEPEVRLDWSLAMIGDLGAAENGLLKLATRGAVHIRLVPASGG